MSVIGSWIKKTFNGTTVDYAVYTKSEYYTLPNGVMIRVSDHFKQSFDELYNIQIITSKNNPTVYLLQCETCLSIYTFTCAEVKSFVRNYVLINDMRMFTKQVSIDAREKTMTSSKKKKLKLQEEERKTILNECEARSQEYGYSVFASELCKKFKRYKTFKPSTKKLVKRLAALPISFNEVIEHLNSAIDEKQKFNIDVFKQNVENLEKTQMS